MVHEKTEKRTEEIIDVPGMAQYDPPPPSAGVPASGSLPPLRGHASCYVQSARATAWPWEHT